MVYRSWFVGRCETELYMLRNLICEPPTPKYPLIAHQMPSRQSVLLLAGECPRVIADDLRYVESVKIRDSCSSTINRWDITVSFNTDRLYRLEGHCKCSDDNPDCYAERRNKDLFTQQGRCSGTDCSKQHEKEWMEAAHSDCATMLGCSARCQIPPKCSGGCCHDYWRCVPESAEKASVACAVRSESTADAQGVQTACMKLKADRAEPGAVKQAGYRCIARGYTYVLVYEFLRFWRVACLLRRLVLVLILPKYLAIVRRVSISWTAISSV